MTFEPPRLDFAGPVWRTVRRQWRQMQEVYHGAEPQTKRSPKERSAVPGTVMMVSQVALDDLGIIAPPNRPTRRLGSGQQDREGMGTDLVGHWPRGWSSYAFAQALSNQQSL